MEVATLKFIWASSVFTCKLEHVVGWVWLDLSKIFTLWHCWLHLVEWRCTSANDDCFHYNQSMRTFITIWRRCSDAFVHLAVLVLLNSVQSVLRQTVLFPVFVVLGYFPVWFVISVLVSRGLCLFVLYNILLCCECMSVLECRVYECFPSRAASWYSAEHHTWTTHL